MCSQAGSDSTVAVPAVQYPSGYQVVVSGAKVVSEGGILTLASCSGATKVTLTVQPRIRRDQRLLTQPGRLRPVKIVIRPYMGGYLSSRC